MNKALAELKAKKASIMEEIAVHNRKADKLFARLVEVDKAIADANRRPT